MKARRTKAKSGQYEKEKRIKPGPRPEFEKVHQVRDLRKRIKKHLVDLYGTGWISDCSDELIDAVMRDVTDWLKDCQHEFRMARQLKEQVVVELLIKKLQ